ncbi:unnamed protein product [Cuscuta europaea]|uniref:GRF-type domain-containing protein n=1 Tax=Cuscuta europaea TaxID=41803 RepID=A0A9P0YRH8_CUSEU|nr:unnamed protein product [Cuscuta europaea]
MRRAYFYGSGSSSMKSSTEANPKMYCYHNMNSTVRIVKNGLNFGKKYHVCCLWPVENCGFFKWEDDIKVNSFPATKELDALEKQALIIALQFRIRWFKENCKEMQAHNEKLKKEKEHLKKEVCQMCTKTEVCQMCGAHFEVFKK